MSKYNKSVPILPILPSPHRNAEQIWRMEEFRVALEHLFEQENILRAARLMISSRTLADSHGAVVNKDKTYQVQLKGKPSFAASSDELATLRNCLNTMNLPTSFGGDVRITEGGNRIQGIGPTVRIGDDERNVTLDALQEHFAKGRISQEEYEFRSDMALQCHTQPELDELLADMPVAKVSKPAPPAPRWQPNFDRIAHVVLILALLAGVIQIFIQH